MSGFDSNKTSPQEIADLISDDGAPFRHIDAVQEFSDILVSYWAGTMDRCSGLRNVVDVVALQDEFVLQSSRFRDGHALQHRNMSDGLFTQEVSNLNQGSTLLDNAIDREMCVNQSHLVSESLRDTSDHVFDERFDCSQAGDMFPPSLPDCKGDLVLLALDELNVHVNVSNVLLQLPSWSFYINDA